MIFVKSISFVSFSIHEKSQQIPGSMGYYGPFIMDMVAMGKRKHLIDMNSTDEYFPERRFRMWKFSVFTNLENIPGFQKSCFSQVVSLPYRGFDYSNLRIYDPEVCIISWDEINAVKANLLQWNEKYLCDAEVRLLLVASLVNFILWVQSKKNASGKLTKTKLDGVLFDQNVDFPLTKGNNGNPLLIWKLIYNCNFVY